MLSLFLDKHKLRFMVHRQWAQKIDSNTAVENINKKVGYEVISNAELNKLYSKFDKDNTDILDNDLKLFTHSSSLRELKASTNPILFSTQSDEFTEQQMNTFDGRFWIFPCYCEKMERFSINIYDLFKDTNRPNPALFNVTNTKFSISGEYLLVVEKINYADVCKFYVYKIDYENLNIKIVSTSNIVFLFDFVKILLDQLDEKKFMIHDNERFIIGQIRGYIVKFTKSKVVEENYIHAKRMIENKVQGFDYNRYNIISTMKFIEFSLETMEEKKVEVPIVLKNSDLDLKNSYIKKYCWSDAYFYGMFQMKNNQYQVLCFNSETLKWIDVKIGTNKPVDMFIDKGEILTFDFSRYFETSRAIYRINLRKPEKLLNLARLAALSESTLYGNDKYVKVSKKIQS